MLWYKAWLETRVRFLICLIAILAFCVYGVHSDYQISNEQTPLLFRYAVVHNGFDLITGMWLVAVVFLTMGGLLRELAMGAAPFTLSLPFSRARLMRVRICVGLGQSLALIIIPGVAVFVESRMSGTDYPASQVLFHLVLMVSGGLLFFAIALLAASLVEGEYTAPLVAFCVIIGVAAGLRNPPAQSWSPFRFMLGDDYFDRSIELFTGSIPWLHAALFILCAALLLVAAVKAIEVREF